MASTWSKWALASSKARWQSPHMRTLTAMTGRLSPARRSAPSAFFSQWHRSARMPRLLLSSSPFSPRIASGSARSSGAYSRSCESIHSASSPRSLGPLPTSRRRRCRLPPSASQNDARGCTRSPRPAPSLAAAISALSAASSSPATSAASIALAQSPASASAPPPRPPSSSILSTPSPSPRSAAAESAAPRATASIALPSPRALATLRAYSAAVSDRPSARAAMASSASDPLSAVSA
mmetsp:Transcript_16698/g.51894  ORF Transcript_16698/g.51894 Transcript_16698/m.51894 type:complete len:237 (+) Transcript_16698:153-863(+)